MAFLEKIGAAANKVGKAAGEGFEYSKAKGKIALEKGKVKEGQEALGAYVYETFKAGAALEEAKVQELVAAIEEHVKLIEELEATAKANGEEFKGNFKKEETEAAPVEEKPAE